MGGTARNPSHDTAGNLSVIPDRTDLTKADRYTYGYKNRLLKVERSGNYNGQTPTWDLVVEYLYDASNRRVKKDLQSGTDVVYLYDGWRCIEEKDYVADAWHTKRQYVFGGLYLDEPLIFDRNEDPTVDEDCAEAGDKRYLYCHNDNFNVVALTDKDGVVAERYSYDPYGQCTVTLDDSSTNPWRFQGQRYCPETGLYYFKNRDLNPPMGRFMQRDPVSYTDGMSLYAAYFAPFGNDPLGTACCGPDVSAALRKTLREVYVRASNWTSGQLRANCNALYKSTTRGGAWDIQELKWHQHDPDWGNGHCRETAEVEGQCYAIEAINYILWGYMNKLCGSSKDVTLGAALAWRVSNHYKDPKAYTMSNVADVLQFSGDGLNFDIHYDPITNLTPLTGGAPSMNISLRDCKSSGVKWKGKFTSAWADTGEEAWLNNPSIISKTGEVGKWILKEVARDVYKVPF